MGLTFLRVSKKLVIGDQHSYSPKALKNDLGCFSGMPRSSLGEPHVTVLPPGSRSPRQHRQWYRVQRTLPRNSYSRVEEGCSRSLQTWLNYFLPWTNLLQGVRSFLQQNCKDKRFHVFTTSFSFGYDGGLSTSGPGDVGKGDVKDSDIRRSCKT